MLLTLFYDYQYNQKFSRTITPNITSNIKENLLQKICFAKTIKYNFYDQNMYI